MNLSNCMLAISNLIYNRHIKINMAKTELDYSLTYQSHSHHMLANSATGQSPKSKPDTL